MLLTSIWKAWLRQLDNQLLHLVLFHHPNIILDELEGLNGLNEVLLVEILLITLAILLLVVRDTSLGYFGHELG